MTKQELFKKYNIDESHSAWDESIDNWMSVEICRLVNNGNLPEPKNISARYVTDFLDKQEDFQWWAKNVMSRPDFGNLYLTAKRLVYRTAVLILLEIK